jgi:UDPglucose 6-dehydrogenase
MIQDVAMKNGNINVDVVTKALANANIRITSGKYMTAGMGDAGPCHPRDNIALRHLSQQLDLGYDIFDTIMLARERQAENLALYLINLQKLHDLPIIIHGKAYKPNVDILDGSYSLLIGSYLDELGANFSYADPLTNDLINDGTSAIILLAHNQQITYGYTGPQSAQPLYFKPGVGSVVVDPWRKFRSIDTSISVIHYGNTRQHR